MNRVILSLLIAGIMALPIIANADTVIDTSGDWDGSINFLWEGSGQSLTVPDVDTTFDSIGFFFDAEADGQVFTFELNDALNGGSTLFSTDFTVDGEFNLIDINQQLTAGQLVFAQIDYNGYVGNSAHFIVGDVYSGGSSSFFNGIDHDDFGGSLFDHRFTATFSGVPEPSSMLVVTGISGLAILRRRRL